MRLNPLKEKYHELYWDMAHSAERQSVAQRETVGAVIVTPSGIVLPGWNGQPAGHTTNCCETSWIESEQRFKTDRTVLHAENNAIGKATQAGVSLAGAYLFSTVSPCDPCARQIVPSGIVRVYFDRLHDDLTGLWALTCAGISIHSRHLSPAHLQQLLKERFE